MPPGATTWDDLVRGEITIEHSQIPDFALTRSDGHPLYLLAAAADDVAMEMTHIIRGEDLVAATPRQLSLYAALGHPQERWPAFGHVPLIVGADNAPLSKRNGEVSIAWYRGHGFLPEAMVNYLSLLGWSPGGDREFFDSGVLVAEFSTDRVSRNPARFDLRKLEALNGDHIRALDEAMLARRLAPVLAAAGLSADPGLLRSAVPLVQTRMSRLTDAADLLRFLLVDEADFQIEDHARAKALGDPAGGVLLAVGEAFEALPSWDAGEPGGQPMVGGGAAGAQQAQGLGAGTGCGDGPDGVTAPVRVDGAARPWAHACPAGGRCPRVKWHAARPGAVGTGAIGVWGNWQPDGFWLR